MPSSNFMPKIHPGFLQKNYPKLVFFLIYLKKQLKYICEIFDHKQTEF